MCLLGHTWQYSDLSLSSVLRNHSWKCTCVHSCAEDQIRVRCKQDKHVNPVYCFFVLSLQYSLKFYLCWSLIPPLWWLLFEDRIFWREYFPSIQSFVDHTCCSLINKWRFFHFTPLLPVKAFLPSGISRSFTLFTCQHRWHLVLAKINSSQKWMLEVDKPYVLILWMQSEHTNNKIHYIANKYRKNLVTYIRQHDIALLEI